MTKQFKTETVERLSRWDFDGETLGDIRDKLAAWITAYGEDAKMDIYFYGDSDSDWEIKKTREETDEEYEARLRKAADTKTIKEAQERAQLAALQAKYGQN